jgi:hypothetical protein
LATGVIDISKFFHTHLSHSDLENYVLHNKGGSAKHVLKFILQPMSVILTTAIISIDNIQLANYGPHLLASFLVYDEFMYGEQLSYRGKPTGKPIGLHAMIIVGVRVGKGSKLFLLQNWWPKKQFREVVEV